MKARRRPWLTGPRPAIVLGCLAALGCRNFQSGGLAARGQPPSPDAARTSADARPPDAGGAPADASPLPPAAMAAPPPCANACGGCRPLAAAPGAGCGACGHYQCNGKEDVVCLDPGNNACGGCTGLPPLGAACGACGKTQCNGKEGTVCADPGKNACGGCAKPPAVGARCGTCD